MRRFIEGADRGQSTLLPECLDDWVDESNPAFNRAVVWNAKRAAIWK